MFMLFLVNEASTIKMRINVQHDNNYTVLQYLKSKCRILMILLLVRSICIQKSDFLTSKLTKNKKKINLNF